MSYSERVLYDRYSIKDPEAKLNEGDIVVVTQEEIDPYTGNTKESRLIGIIRKEKGDIFDVTLKHSGDNDSDRKVLIDVPRNLLEYVVEQDYESVCARISRGIIAQEDVDDDEKKTFKKEIYEATRSMEFIPAGRILAGLGRDENQDFTLFNCYVFSIPSDSREGIGTHWLRLLNTYATGGGVGWNISILRPRGSLVKKVNGRSSGAVSWAEQFSQITGVVEQGGSRRGAGLQGLWVWHPDIEEFITTKSLYKKIDTKEGKRVEVCANLLTNSNVSVLISDDFMEAVEANDEWELIFPDTKYPDYDETWDGDIWKWQREGKPIEIYKTINARDLWQKIVYHAWRSGEPGILFLERFNKMSNSYYYDRIVCTNPCVTGDTKVATSTGYVNARDLKVGMKIRTLVGLRPIDKVYNNGKKKIYRVTFSDGASLIVPLTMNCV